MFPINFKVKTLFFRIFAFNLAWVKSPRMKSPGKNLAQMDAILVEQFLRKGYQLKEVVEQNATIIIFTNQKKQAAVRNNEAAEDVLQQQPYKDLFKNN